MAINPAEESEFPADPLTDILARFDRYHPARIDLTLDRTFRLLDELGNPHHNLPPVIHVAGTNGKGSTIAFLRAIYEAAGQAVSVYTSPHLVNFTERFVLAGQEISFDGLCDLLEEVDAANAGKPITQFEIVTAAAFLALSRTPADVVLLETGLGGRFDTTNVVDKPLATIITPVAMDHQEFLGADIASIAGEKAAIQKTGVPSIVAPQLPDAATVINKAAEQVGAPLFRAGEEWGFEIGEPGFVFRNSGRELVLPSPALAGDHQIVNAATAIACLTVCANDQAGDEAISQGLTNVAWPGRLELLGDGPLRQRLPDDWRIWLDAGHNPAAGEALATALRQINDAEQLPVHIVFAMLDDKDPVAYLQPLAGFANSITAVPLSDEPRSHDPEASVAALTEAGMVAGCVPTLGHALEGLAKIPAPAHVVICGSHTLAGMALRENQAG